MRELARNWKIDFSTVKAGLSTMDKNDVIEVKIDGLQMRIRFGDGVWHDLGAIEMIPGMAGQGVDYYSPKPKIWDETTKTVKS